MNLNHSEATRASPAPAPTLTPTQTARDIHLLTGMSILLVSLLIVIISVSLHLFIRNRRANIEEFKRRCRIPLVSEPGPFGGNLLEVLARPDNCQLIDHFHHKLGPTYGLFYGPDPWVMSVDLDLIQRVFVAEGLVHVDATDFRLPFVTEINESLAQLRGDKWRSVRRCMGTSFTLKSMKSDNVFRDISAVCDLFEEMLEGEQRRQNGPEWGSGSRVDGSDGGRLEVDVLDAFKKFSLEVIFRVAFGVEHRSRLSLGERDEILDWLDKGSRLVNGTLVHLGIMFAPARRLLSLCSQFTPLGACIKHIHSIMSASLAERCRRRWQAAAAEQGGQRAPSAWAPGGDPLESKCPSAPSPLDRKLIDSLIERFGLGAASGALSGGGGLIERENEQSLRANLFFIMVAGHETSSNTLAVMFWLLAKHQPVQERLRQAILSDGSDDAGGQYLDWVIWETLRLHPAVPAAIGRVLEHDVEHGGVLFPRGTTIIASIWSMHRWAAFWGPDAAQFRPERFGEPAGECAGHRHHAMRFFAFGEGPRYCIGKHLAMAEIKAIVRRLLARYQIGLCQDTCERLKTMSPNLIHFIIEQPIKLAFERITRL